MWVLDDNKITQRGKKEIPVWPKENAKEIIQHKEKKQKNEENAMKGKASFYKPVSPYSQFHSHRKTDNKIIETLFSKGTKGECAIKRHPLRCLCNSVVLFAAAPSYAGVGCYKDFFPRAMNRLANFRKPSDSPLDWNDLEKSVVKRCAQKVKSFTDSKLHWVICYEL